MVKFLDLKACNEKHMSSIQEALSEVARSGWYILGEQVSSFENEFAEYCGAKHCIGVSNGLDALTLMMEASGIGPGDEVIVPANTYIATWLAVSTLGAVPVPVEPNELTYNIEAKTIEEAISSKTKAVLVVHLYGKLCSMSDIVKLCDDKGLMLFEDSAQAHGTTQSRKRSGTFGLASGFSFYPGKNLGALGDAGCVVTNDDDLAQKVRVLRNYGSEKKYYNMVKGKNCRLDEMQAAVLRKKLPSLDSENQHRMALAKIYLKRLSEVEDLDLPVLDEGEDHTWHIFPVRYENRSELMGYLKEKNIDSLIHYPVPPHLSEAYADLGYSKGSFPISEKIADFILSLPMGPHLTADDVNFVCDEILSFFSNK